MFASSSGTTHLSTPCDSASEAAGHPACRTVVANIAEVGIARVRSSLAHIWIWRADLVDHIEPLANIDGLFARTFGTGRTTDEAPTAGEL